MNTKNLNLIAVLFMAFLFSACGKKDSPIVPEVVVPTVSLTSVKDADVTFTTAKVTAAVTIKDESKITSRGIVYGAVSKPTITDSMKMATINTFTLSIANLLAGTKYYVRGFAKANGETYYSNEISFTTRSLAATTWDFLHIHDVNTTWHADVTFNADGTTKYDEPANPGLYLYIGKWKMTGNTLTYALKGDFTATSYVYTGTFTDTGMKGTYNFGTLNKQWTAVLK